MVFIPFTDRLLERMFPFIIFRDFFPSHLQSTTVELLCPKLKSNDQLLNTIDNFRSYFVKIHTSGSDSKESACSAGDLDLIPGSEDPLEKGMAVHSSFPFPFHFYYITQEYVPCIPLLLLPLRVNHCQPFSACLSVPLSMHLYMHIFNVGWLNCFPVFTF